MGGLPAGLLLCAEKGGTFGSSRGGHLWAMLLGGLRMRSGKEIGMEGWDGGGSRRGAEKEASGEAARAALVHAADAHGLFASGAAPPACPPTPDFCGCGAGLLGQETPAM